MVGLQRSSMSFRRQGSSGFVWDDRFLSGELKQQQVAQDLENGEENEIIMVKDVKPPRPIKTVQRSRSNGGGRGYRGSGKITPAIEPLSPKVSACGFCGGFGKPSKNNVVWGAKPGKRNRSGY
ncbi:PREDICTED: uncharacterized protein At1g15400 [Fragaria vesca subsp. vesca]|uniref:uncharacterized protein At1g15400 n=1 Tax=Fragaria vesca subsp. vesca TaxID=101020 RepID=UPI0002C342DA|nr:PREDICTED: uncharacterized protein At1g15400 [Fragaria vesca subsp. vesca]